MRFVPFEGTALGFGDLARGHPLCHSVSIRDGIITGVSSVSGCCKVEPHVSGFIILNDAATVAVSQPELQLCHSSPLVCR